ncbi:MAG: sigma-70 family RNA polymerase sigma factor, partial [Myxococcales bacterium]|nr:sigma-70 family RNA polymerase sigma factor [Myxococcales bacterium]
MSRLSEVYRAARPDASSVTAEGALEEAAARQAARWAGLDEEALVRAWAALPAAFDALDDPSRDEVGLALACANGLPNAWRELERTCFGPALAALKAMKLEGDLEAEVMQEVRRKLLVAEDGPAKIVGYAGRGSLPALVKVTATRTAISMLRKLGRQAPGDDAIVDVTGETDPELAFLKERYRAAFREAFAEAVQTLEAHERNLLRLHFLRKVTLEKLAEMYGVHRATVVRQLAQVRATIEKRTRAGLVERLAADRREIDSVMELVK